MLLENSTYQHELEITYSIVWDYLCFPSVPARRKLSLKQILLSWVNSVLCCLNFLYGLFYIRLLESRYPWTYPQWVPSAPFCSFLGPHGSPLTLRVNFLLRWKFQLRPIIIFSLHILQCTLPHVRELHHFFKRRFLTERWIFLSTLSCAITTNKARSWREESFPDSFYNYNIVD